MTKLKKYSLIQNQNLIGQYGIKLVINRWQVTDTLHVIN